MTVLILEDEERTGKHLEELVKQCDSSIQVTARIPSVKKAEQWLSRNKAPDLILMDIHLEDTLVFELFKMVTITSPVIFTTAYDEYMVQAFKVNSIDYLLKPVQFSDVQSALSKYKVLQKHFNQFDYNDLMDHLGKPDSAVYKDRFMITVGSKMHTIETKEIAYFILESKVTRLVTQKNKSYVVDYNLDTLASMLDPKFFLRVNRQCIISITSIVHAHQVSSGKITLELQPTWKEEVSVSGDRIAAFKQWLGK